MNLNYKKKINEEVIIKTSSAKSKGRRLQQHVRDLLLEKTEKYGLVSGDIESIGMGQSGRDVLLSPAAEKVVPFDIETKNQEKINIWSAIEQAEYNTKKGRIPMVVFKRNRSKVYACIELDKLIDLLYEK